MITADQWANAIVAKLEGDNADVREVGVKTVMEFLKDGKK
jgi:hypothetical protein